jgi:photosystem II stability/assembly factor-like uncharacterized protein
MIVLPECCGRIAVVLSAWLALAACVGPAALAGEAPLAATKDGPAAPVDRQTQPQPAAPQTGPWVNVTNNVGGDAWGYAGVCTIACRSGADEVIAGVSERGLWASTDGGQTWAPMGAEAKVKITHRPYAIVFDPRDANTFWESGNYGMGVFKTTDGGKTFERLGATVANVDGLSVDFSDPDRKTIVIGFHEKIRFVMKSADGGKTWRQIGTNLPQKTNHSTNPLVLDAKTYLVNTAGWVEDHAFGIYRTEDAGQTWTRVSDRGTAGQPLLASDGTIYWGQIWDRGLLKSTDGGKTWTAVAGPVKRTPIEVPGGKLVAAAGARLYFSADGAATWKPIGPPAPFAPQAWAYNEKRNCFFVSRSTEKKSDSAIARLDLTQSLGAALPRMLVVWDGDTAAGGKGWAQPKATTSIQVQAAEVHAGNGALQMHAEAKGWAGGGWNWLGWWPKDGGTDLTGFRNLSLWMKVAGAKPQGGGIKVAMACSAGDKTSAEADVVKACPEIFDGKWHEVVIPLEWMLAGKPEFNPKKAWQLNVSVVGAEIKLDAYIDDICFDDRPAASAAK